MKAGRESQTAVMVCMARAMADGRPDVAGFTDPTALALLPEEATLAVVARRSAPRSRLVVLYLCPALMSRVVGLFVRRVGEPFRSAFTPEQMSALLARHRFAVTRDESLPVIGTRLSTDLAQATRVMKHMHVGTADRPT
jgi:O-methyltransferase involved in polyketide biosynthesis